MLFYGLNSLVFSLNLDIYIYSTNFIRSFLFGKFPLSNNHTNTCSNNNYAYNIRNNYNLYETNDTVSIVISSALQTSLAASSPGLFDISSCDSRFVPCFGLFVSVSADWLYNSTTVSCVGAIAKNSPRREETFNALSFWHLLEVLHPQFTETNAVVCKEYVGTHTQTKWNLHGFVLKKPTNIVYLLLPINFYQKLIDSLIYPLRLESTEICSIFIYLDYIDIRSIRLTIYSCLRLRFRLYIRNINVYGGLDFTYARNMDGGNFIFGHLDTTPLLWRLCEATLHIKYSTIYTPLTDLIYSIFSIDDYVRYVLYCIILINVTVVLFDVFKHPECLSFVSKLLSFQLKGGNCSVDLPTSTLLIGLSSYYFYSSYWSIMTPSTIYFLLLLSQ